MHPCFLCPNTKRLVKEVTNQMKGLSKGRRQRKKGRPDTEEVAGRKNKEAAALEEEWVAEPEAGVLITLVPQGDGSNYIKKIRFREGIFDALEAQKWWSDNYDRLMELYSIRLHPWPYQSDEEENSNEPPNAIGADQVTSISKEEDSGTRGLKGVKGKVVKWVVEDEPGVFVTMRALPDDTKEIVRVELCRERFAEVNARVWWEENKARLQEQYI